MSVITPTSQFFDYFTDLMYKKIPEMSENDPFRKVFEQTPVVPPSKDGKEKSAKELPFDETIGLYKDLSADLQSLIIKQALDPRAYVRIRIYSQARAIELNAINILKQLGKYTEGTKDPENFLWNHVFDVILKQCEKKEIVYLLAHATRAASFLHRTASYAQKIGESVFLSAYSILKEPIFHIVLGSVVAVPLFLYSTIALLDTHDYLISLIQKIGIAVPIILTKTMISIQATTLLISFTVMLITLATHGRDSRVNQLACTILFHSLFPVSHIFWLAVKITAYVFGLTGKIFTKVSNVSYGAVVYSIDFRLSKTLERGRAIWLQQMTGRKL